MATPGPEDIIFNTTAFNIGGWTVNLGTGEITVPAGITHVNILSQIHYSALDSTSMTEIQILLNAAQLDAISGYDLAIRGAALTTSLGAGRLVDTAHAPFVPVSSGDVIKVQGERSAGLGSVNHAEQGSWLYVEKAA